MKDMDDDYTFGARLREERERLNQLAAAHISQFYLLGIIGHGARFA